MPGSTLLDRTERSYAWTPIVPVLYIPDEAERMQYAVRQYALFCLLYILLRDGHIQAH